MSLIEIAVTAFINSLISAYDPLFWEQCQQWAEPIFIRFAYTIAQRLRYGAIYGVTCSAPKSLKTHINKNPCMSLIEIAVTTFINSLISAYDSTAQKLAARINQNDHL